MKMDTHNTNRGAVMRAETDEVFALWDKTLIFERFQLKNSKLMKGFSLILKSWTLLLATFFLGQSGYAQSCAITYSGSPCVGAPITFTGTAAGTNHEWTFNDGGVDNKTNGSLNVNYAFKTAGKNKVTYSTTINGQKCQTSIDIDIFEKPKIDLSIVTLDSQCFLNNLFCFTDNTKNPNGKKIVNAKYVVGDGQFFEYDFPPSSMPNQLCFSIKDVRGGSFSLYIESTDENGCTDTQNIADAVFVREKIGAAFSSNKPVKCDSVEAKIKNISRIGKDQVDSIWWYWGDGQKTVGVNPVDDKDWGPDISHWFYGQGVYDSKLIIRTKDGCKDSFFNRSTASVFTSKVKILADKDSTCISSPEIKFSVDQIPAGVNGFLWTFGDPNSGPENTNFRTWTPPHRFTGLGPFLITLAYNHPICGPALIMDTIIILGPRSVVDVTGDRILDWQVFQCPKDVMDTVYFRNYSTFYHNDLDFTDDDSTFYKDGTTALGHNFQNVGGAWVWIPPKRRERNENGDTTVYTGSGPLLPGAHNDPFKRERVCATRLWDFGDNFGSKCTTDILNNKNVNVNCNFSRDTIPYHYYPSWDMVMLSDFKMAPMEDARFIDSNGICIRVPVFPDSMFYIIYDTLVYIPKDATDSATYLNSGIQGTESWGLEKKVVGKGERFMEFYAAIELDAGNTATIIKNGVKTVVTGPLIDTLAPKDIIILNSENDSVYFNYTVYLKRDTLPYNLYKIRAAKGENIARIDSFKRIPPGIAGYNYIINYERFRSLYYARIPSCNNVRLKHQDTCHPMACEDEATRQIVLMHANAGGVGSGLIKDAIECLGSRNPTYGVTFILSDLKPGCSFTELQINYDTFCGNNWVSLSSLNPGGRPVVPPSPPPYWDGTNAGNPNPGYNAKGNPGSRFSTYYMGKPCNDSTGCVTVGVIVGNGVARPGGSAAARPLCADTHYYDRFACFPFIDPSFEILNLVKNDNGDYKICKWDPIIARFTPNNFTKVDDLMTLRWILQTSNAGPYYVNFSSSFIQEDVYRYQKIKKPFMLPNGKMSNPDYLYNYIVQTRGYEDPVQTPCENEWNDGNATITSGPDTIWTAEIRDYVLAADVSKVWDRIRERLDAAGFDPFALGDTTIAKMIWNDTGTIGQPSTGAYGCLDTAGYGKDIRYYYIPNKDSMSVFHFRDSTITPLDTNKIFGADVNSYTFVPRHAGRYILGVSMRSDNGECDDIAAVPLIVGFAMFGDLFTDSIVCQDQGESLVMAPDYRYFSTDPDNFGTWDPNYWNNKGPLATGYDYWKDPARLVRLVQGDTNVERMTQWDWSKEDNDPANPDTYEFRGDYGASGGVGTLTNPYIQLGGGSGLYYKNDSGVFTFMNITGDSTGCLDTITKRVYISRLDVAFNLGLEVPSCNSIIEFFDSSELHDPCNWAMKNCYGPTPMVCDFVNKWFIDWGDGSDNYFERAKNSEAGLPPRIAHKYTRNGWFKIRYSLNTDQGCGDTFERWVKIPGPRPAFEFADKAGREVTICVGDSIRFRNTTDSAGVQSDWTWFFGDGAIKNAPDTFVTHQYNVAGRYEVYLEQFDSLIVPPNIRKFCPAVFPDTLSKQEKFIITVLPRDSVRGLIVKPVICPGDSNVFIDNSDTILKSYKWKFEHYSAQAGQWVTDTVSTTNQRYARKFSDPGVYRVTHYADYDQNHPRPWCPTLMEPLTFTVDSVVANFDIDSTNKPDFTFTRTDVNGTQWRWGFVHFDGDMDLQKELPREFKEQSQSNNQKVQWSYDSSGRYWVCLIATNSSGCSDTICKPVNIDLFINLSNVFTPSGDGLNDEFRVPLQGQDVYEIRIFNRWGERVFFSEDPKVSWNGKVNNDGPDAPSGTYYYQMQYRFKGKEKVNRVNGTVNLIRPVK